MTTASQDSLVPAHLLFDRSRVDRHNLFNRERLLHEIESSSLDGVIATSSENVTYTSGAYFNQLLLSMFVVTSSSGQQAMIVNEADAYHVRDSSWIEDVRDFRFGPTSDQDALELLEEAVRDLDLVSGRLGLERNSLSAASTDALQRSLPKATLADGSPVFSKTRLIKTPAEISLFGAAAFATAKAIATGFSMARPGDTEKALQASMQAAVLQLGADSLAHAHVHSGPHSTVVHTHSVERPISAGEVIHVDFGGVFGGYSTDLARNAVVLRPDPRQAEIYRRLWEIEELLFTSIKPGVVASELFEISDKAHRDAGLEYPWGTIGHSTGLAVHEGFEMSRGSNVAFETGMILNIEPSHIETADARYHIEDTVVVTEDGARWLSDFSRDPEIFRIV